MCLTETYKNILYESNIFIYVNSGYNGITSLYSQSFKYFYNY